MEHVTANAGGVAVSHSKTAALKPPATSTITENAGKAVKRPKIKAEKRLITVGSGATLAIKLIAESSIRLITGQIKVKTEPTVRAQPVTQREQKLATCTATNVRRELTVTTRIAVNVAIRVAMRAGAGQGMVSPPKTAVCKAGRVGVVSVDTRKEGDVRQLNILIKRLTTGLNWRTATKTAITEIREKSWSVAATKSEEPAPIATLGEPTTGRETVVAMERKKVMFWKI